MLINFNELDLAFRCHRVVFEWERFGIESFQNDTSLSHYVYSLFFSLYIRMHKSEDIFRSPVLVQIPIYTSLFLSISATRVKLTCICFPLQSLYWFELCWHVLIINWLLLAVLCANSTVVLRLCLLCAEACCSLGKFFLLTAFFVTTVVTVPIWAVDSRGPLGGTQWPHSDEWLPGHGDRGERVKRWAKWN